MAQEVILPMERIKELYERLCSWKGTQKYAKAFAGGCVRDSYMGKPIKDFDLFVQTPTNWTEDPFAAKEEVEEFVDILNAALYCNGKSASTNISINTHSNAPSAADNVKVFTVWQWKAAWHNLPLDVVFTYESPADHVVKDFDFGICQAWFGSTGLRTTRNFQQDYFNKTITYLLDEKSRPFKLDHLDRLRTKFPNWKVRNWGLPLNPLP